MIKKITSYICILPLFFCAVGCANHDGEDNIVETTKYDLNEIEYGDSMFENEKTIDDSDLNIVVPQNAQTGETVTVTTSCKASVIVGGAMYSIVDWGDGTWSYKGPATQNSSRQTNMKHHHEYKSAGEYTVSTAAYCIEKNQMLGWTSGNVISVKGENVSDGNLVSDLKLISSESSGEEFNVGKVLDSKNNTYFKSANARDIHEEQYVGFLFNTIYTLSKLEVQIPKAAEVFPSDIAVEFTTDAGKTWYSLPKYYYVTTANKEIYSPIMRFPNPQGATLIFDLDGIVANGIRFVSKTASIIGSQKYLAVSEMRVYGRKEVLLYTSLGGTFDADLNNFWTMFGTAKTEQNLTGDDFSGMANPSPFRGGQALIGSTEWLEWNGLKFNWTDYDSARDAAFSYLKRTRTGSDGWSDDDGYVWATPDGQYHLDMGAHYTYNSIFILAARNYLLQGNGENGGKGLEYNQFMSLRNSVGQTMKQRLEKAMNYMLETLEGENGLLIINDPRNQALGGAFDSVASNYWDAMTAFGYISSYENIFYYASLLAYADILQLGGEDATYFVDLAKEVKRKFNETFWDEEKGRYITSINKNGVKLDFGVTYVNFMACAYDLCSDAQREKIYSWLDGSRIINGDTSTGKDIYGEFGYAARGNTLDVSKITDENGKYYWWYSDEIMSPASGMGAYGEQMQNGGTILYISYYDLLGRYGYDNTKAFERFKVIMEEFHKDCLRRNKQMNGHEYIEGIVGEFPESGLVPYSFVNGLCGISAQVEGLLINPNLPQELEYAGVSTYKYNGNIYSIRISKKINNATIEEKEGKFFVTIPAGESYYITRENQLLRRSKS